MPTARIRPTQRSAISVGLTRLANRYAPSVAASISTRSPRGVGSNAPPVCHNSASRPAQYQTGKRRVVVAARQRGGRTITFVAPSEAPGVERIPRLVAKGAKIIADEATHWDVLHGTFEAERINHSVAYSLDGVNTNMVESFFSRLRRMVSGQHHHVSAQYLHQYAAHAAWLEDHRRLDNGALTHRALGLALHNQKSRVWAGYWQRSFK